MLESRVDWHNVLDAKLPSVDDRRGTGETGADDGNRTRDLIFTKDLLCH